MLFSRTEEENSDEMSEEEDSLDDDRHLTSFVSLLGVNLVLPYREPAETAADKSRVSDQTKKSTPFKTTNAAMLDGLNLDLVTNYDESFLKLWDIDAGFEMLSYMSRQTENYRREADELDQENGTMEAELNVLRRKKRDAFFLIKDYEAEAVEAERRHRQLSKMRPKKLVILVLVHRPEYFWHRL